MVGGRIKDVPKKVNNLNRENSRIIWTYIQDAGDKLVGKLPPSPSPERKILMPCGHMCKGEIRPVLQGNSR